MDFLDRLLDHDAWTTQSLLNLCAPLGDEQLDRPFEIGHATVRATLAHIVRNVEVWSGLMSGDPPEELRRHLASPDTIRSLMDRHVSAAERLAVVARSVLERDAWDEYFQDTLEHPPTRKSFGGAIAHVITHSMHHRAQVLFMLRRIGIEDLPEGDVLSWESRMNSEGPA